MYAALFAVFGLHMPYVGLWLEARGLDAATIGTIGAIPLILRVVANPLIAIAADQQQRHADYARGLVIAGALAALGLAFADTTIAIALALALMLVAIQSSMPLIEVVATRGAGTHGFSYSGVRLWGSVSFIAAVAIGGAAIERAGPQAFLPLLLAAVLLSVAAVVLLPTPPRTEAASSVPDPQANEVDALGRRLSEAPRYPERRVAPLPPSTRITSRHLSGVLSLLLDVRFVVFLFATALIQAAHATYYGFSAIHWSRAGMSGDVIGALWSLGVVAEIVLFATAARHFRSIGAAGLIIAGGLASILRWSAMALEPGLAALIGLQVLHALTFGATHLGAIKFISEQVDPRQAGLAQALMSTATSGVAMAGALYAAGKLYEPLGASSFGVMAALGAAGTLAAFGLSRLLSGKSHAIGAPTRG